MGMLWTTLVMLGGGGGGASWKWKQVHAFSPPSSPLGLRHRPSSSLSFATTRISSSSLSQLGMVGSGGLIPSRGGRPLLSEDDLAVPPNAKVIEAVGKSNSNAVIASDIAASAGVSLSIARQSLSALATLTGGDISVTRDGELLYSFPTNVQAALASNSLRYRLLRNWEKAWPSIFWGVRVGFGVFLFVSIFAIFSTILFVSVAGSGDSDERRDSRDDRRGGGYGMGNFALDLFWPRPSFFFYDPYYGYYGRTPYIIRRRQRLMRQQQRGVPITDDDFEAEDDPNVFERIFSYIFGDGNPNRGIETARLRAAAQVIRANGGAVVADQLAPFCEDVPFPEQDASKAVVDESFVLPIVTQLGGEPVVTPEGDIVYVFPELQLSAQNTLEAAGLSSDASSSEIKYAIVERGGSARGALERADLVQTLERVLEKEEGAVDMTEPLQEEELVFNRSGTGWNVMAGILGGVNLGGALYLGQVLSSPALVGVRLPSYMGLVQAGLPALLLYAVFYNSIPLVRYVLNSRTNAQIRERNAARRQWATRLQVMGSSLRRKLKAAKTFASKMKRLGSSSEDLVYNTQQTVQEEEARREADDLQSFDQLLKEKDDDNDDSGGVFQ